MSNIRERFGLVSEEDAAVIRRIVARSRANACISCGGLLPKRSVAFSVAGTTTGEAQVIEHCETCLGLAQAHEQTQRAMIGDQHEQKVIERASDMMGTRRLG